MFKFIATDAVVSKGFGDNPALRFSEDGTTVRFRIGKRVYDKRAQDNHRWININVKAFDGMCERVKKMKLDEGSYIHFEGRYDEDVWEENGKPMRMPVIILTEIETSYSGSGENKQNGSGTKNAAEEPPVASNDSSGAKVPPQNGDPTASGQIKMPDNFTGFEGFGGPNPFFPQT